MRSLASRDCWSTPERALGPEAAAFSEPLESHPEDESTVLGAHPWVAEGRHQIRFGVAQLVWSSAPEWAARRDFAQQARVSVSTPSGRRITRR